MLPLGAPSMRVHAWLLGVLTPRAVLSQCADARVVASLGQHVLRVLLQLVTRNPGTLASALPLLVEALDDPDIARVIQSEIIEPMTVAIERDLRLHAHALALNQPSLREGASDVHWQALLSLPSMAIGGVKVNIKREVCKRLQKSLYDHATVAHGGGDAALHEHMRLLALEHYVEAALLRNMVFL
ncbi:MAG: hypothetical protein MHM6MM_009382 [Cercozoa sp. M6MM]